MSGALFVPLGPGPVKLPLTAWAQGGVEALLKAASKQQYDEVFEGFFAKHVKIVVNGKHVSREHYKEYILSMTLEETFAQVTFSGSVAVPEDQDDPTAAGTVGLFCTATIDQPSPLSNSHNNLEKVNHLTSSLNLVVIQDESVIPPDGNTFSARRVSVVNEVTVNTSSTLLPLPSVAKA
ncbi:hypothetical protein B0H21DRAFT_749686 [Amylocystis lapponica]|nr:hypothetical protein B0H21DRAFT_749686 [Amylocystis lapponica]